MAEAWGYIANAPEERVLLDRLLALLWRLTTSPKLQPVAGRQGAKRVPSS
ncbi:MAG: hypothetical protein WKG01_35855 [Kofleriaceae bacterium]